MPRAPIALLLLVGGIAVGIVLGLALGSGAGPVLAQGVSLIPGQTQPVFASSAAMDRPAAAGARRVAEPELAQPGETVVPALSRAALDEITTLAAASVGDEDSGEPDEVAAGDRTRMITGVVVDTRGEPIEGATVKTTADAESERIRTRGSISTGRGWTGEPELAATLQKRARSEIENRRKQRVATTDETGAFVLTMLEPGRHSVSAYHEGLSFQNQSVFTGQNATFRGLETHEFTLEVVDSEGAAVPTATIEVLGDYRPTYYAWTPEQPTIRRTDRSLEIRALAGDVVADGNDGAISQFASEARRVTLAVDGPGPHRFELLPTSSVVISVVDQTRGPIVPPTVRYAAASKVLEAGGRSEFVKASATIKSRKDGKFRIANLEPGSYLIGVGRGLSEPEVFHEFTMESTPMHEEVILPALSPERFLVVKVTGSSGRPLSGLRFKIFATRNESASSWNLTSHELAPGEFWIGWDRSADYWGQPVSLSIENPGLGAAIRSVTRDQRRLDVTLADPCTLTVELVADQETSYEITVNSMASVNGEDARSISQTEPEVAKGGGQARFVGLQPGLAAITVRKKSDSNRWSRGTTLARQELTLHSGEMSTTIVVSELHTLTVYAPAEPERARFRVRPAPNQPDGSLAGYGSGNLNAEHVAEISGLAAGRYHLTLEVNGSVPPIEITVPSGVVTYERPETAGYRVTKRRSRSEIAPLMVGDVITAVNGTSVAVGSISDRISLAVAEGKTTLTVWRDEETIDLVLKERPNQVRYAPITSLE